MRPLAIVLSALALLSACGSSSHSGQGSQDSNQRATSGGSSGQGSSSGNSATDAGPTRNDSADAGSDAATRACNGVELPAGFECVQTSSGPAPVIARGAPTGTDACRAAVCAGGARCESFSQDVNGRAYRLPHCATAGSAAVEPMRDPCARYACPAGYQCTSPADAPYCLPAAWF